MNAVTVYCASSVHLDPEFHEPAHALGRELARRGLTLVYGGGGIGLMGEIARCVRAEGGRIVGVITRSLKDREQGYDGCDEFVVVETMRERKRQMMEGGDAFLVLPGGIGTYEEMFEVLVGRLVGEHCKPIGLVNVRGYFDPLITMIEHGIEHRFIKPAVLDLLIIDADPVVVLDRLASAPCGELDDDRYLPMGSQLDPVDHPDGREPA